MPVNICSMSLTNSQGGNKKGAAASTNEGADAPPTPTPPPPVTPNNAASFNQNKNLQMQNGQPGPNSQQNHNGNQVQGPDMSMSAPFGDLGGDVQFTGMDFANLESGDVLDNFDFDSFLNNDDTGGLAFDANFAFGGDASIETDIGGN